MRQEHLDILLMSDNALDTVGGEQESTKIIINGTKVKYKVGVISPGKVNKPHSEVKYFNLTTHTRIKHLVKNPIAFISYILNVKKIINTSNPKVIHTQAQVSFFIVALLLKIKLISRDISLIHTERGLFTKYNKIFKGIFYFFMKELNTLVTTTKFNMKYWQEALTRRGFLLNYTIIENTAGEIFETYNESLDKKSDKQITIGFAGRYTNWKNWPLAVEICEKVNAVIGDSLQVKMAVGCLDDRALDETKLMFSKLEKIFETRFDGKINITLEEINKFYYDIDIFILTSNYNTESFGRTLVEAMSRKTVVLTTDAGGPVEVVGNLDNVHNIADAFVSHVVDLFKDKGKMAEEKEKNLRRVKEIYSLQNNLNKHLDMYKVIICTN
ncbi:glycosyltransferase family 4 protein [Amphibacillus jilinensis]|uniref:glycosyltransferase family 4 protein n=1 Tax=Amphibacillus jilinensis TaxID=1216008 RepID=UPI00031737B5|nr:glycosyltransferase family 4 protein [Amphibacillus jilinensis]